MPLFQTREWWCTECGTGERFDRGSLTVDALVSGERSQVIAVGSHEGVLRLYCPSLPVDRSSRTSSSGEAGQEVSRTSARSVCSFSPDHLLLETCLDRPILALLTGNFLSGSSVVCLLVLSPFSVTVYTLDNIGSTNKSRSGQFRLTAVYSHQLANSAFSVFCKQQTDKPTDKGWFCVISLDGTLTFYERENLAFTCSLPDVILPGPIIFLPASDVIVMASSSYTLEAYKFSSLARLGECQSAGKTDLFASNTSSLYCEWIYNIGEFVLDIQQVVSKGQTTVVVLCQTSLFCLSDKGSLISCLMMDYSPACMTNFTNEKGSVISVICSLAGSLYVYSGNFLRWTARYADAALGGIEQIEPSYDDVITDGGWALCASRVSLSGVSGLLLLLTSNGTLSASYLGTAPVVFVAGASQLSTGSKSDALETSAADMVDYERFDTEMARLNAVIDESLAAESNDVGRGGKSADDKQILRVVTVVDSRLIPCSLPTEVNEEVPSVIVSIAVTCDSPLENVHVVFHVDKPLRASPPYSKISYIEAAASRSITTTIYLASSAALNAPESLNLHVTVTCTRHADRSARANTFSTRSRCRLPLALIMHCFGSPLMTSLDRTAVRLSALPLDGISGSTNEKNSLQCVVIGSRRPLLDVRQLFDDMWRSVDKCDAATAITSVVFGYRGTTGDCESEFVATVRADKSSRCYCVESSDLHALWLVTAELISRLEKLYSDQRHSILALQSPLPLTALYSACAEHLCLRRSRCHQLQQLDQLANQLRAIQRRLISRYKQLQSAVSLLSMEQLMEDTYKKLLQVADGVSALGDGIRQCCRSASGCCRLLVLLAALPQQQQQQETDEAERVGDRKMLAKLLYSVLGWRCEPTDSDEQGWLERVFVAAGYINTRLTSANSISTDTSQQVSEKSVPDPVVPALMPSGETVAETGEFVPDDCSEQLQRHLSQFMEAVVAVDSQQMEALFSERKINDSSRKNSALQAMGARPASSRFTRSAKQRESRLSSNVHDPEQEVLHQRSGPEKLASPENLIDDDDSSEEI